MKLTENEINCLKGCLNYDNRESQLSDNYSNGGMAEFTAQMGGRKMAAAAIVGTLEKKGMGYGEWIKDDDGTKHHIFWLTEEGVNAIFDIIEAE